jgi:hypothetical protein
MLLTKSQAVASSRLNDRQLSESIVAELSKAAIHKEAEHHPKRTVCFQSSPRLPLSAYPHRRDTRVLSGLRAGTLNGHLIRQRTVSMYKGIFYTLSPRLRSEYPSESTKKSFCSFKIPTSVQYNQTTSPDRWHTMARHYTSWSPSLQTYSHKGDKPH